MVQLNSSKTHYTSRKRCQYWTQRVLGRFMLGTQFGLHFFDHRQYWLLAMPPLQKKPFQASYFFHLFVEQRCQNPVMKWEHNQFCFAFCVPFFRFCPIIRFTLFLMIPVGRVPGTKLAVYSISLFRYLVHMFLSSLIGIHYGETSITVK